MKLSRPPCFWAVKEKRRTLKKREFHSSPGASASSTRSGFFRKSGSFGCEEGKSADMPENFP
nr:MAG TPA: hypothetical protein [Caudoviricetes sp.]